MTTKTLAVTNKENEGAKIISSVTMVVALASIGMLFLTLMMGFTIFRITSEVWPPAGMTRPSLVFPSVSTFFIALSSWAFYIYEQNILNKKFLSMTLLCGVAFMVSQFLFWSQLKAQGFIVSSGIFASIIYGFTWIHAAHIVTALFLIVWLHTDIKNESKAQLRAENVGKFWHFLGFVWLVMFLSIFVL